VRYADWGAGVLSVSEAAVRGLLQRMSEGGMFLQLLERRGLLLLNIAVALGIKYLCVVAMGSFPCLVVRRRAKGLQVERRAGKGYIGTGSLTQTPSAFIFSCQRRISSRSSCAVRMRLACTHGMRWRA